MLDYFNQALLQSQLRQRENADRKCCFILKYPGKLYAKSVIAF